MIATQNPKRFLGPLVAALALASFSSAQLALEWSGGFLGERTTFSITGGPPGKLYFWLPGLTDPTIAIAAALILFAVPLSLRGGERALHWEDTAKLPWGVVLLFGGGFSLAEAMRDSGLAAWIGDAASGRDVPLPVLLIVIGALFVFLTEMTSNVATANMAMPVMAGAAAAVGAEPLQLMAAAALASSMAFMLPVATPPNAIVFGSGYLTVGQMARAGVVLNVIAVAIVTFAVLYLLPVLG